MGLLVPDSTPSGRVTTSRYWMTGLVAGGIVMFLYTAINMLLGRFNKSYRPPLWWRVWLLCALPLIIGFPLITLTQNKPQLTWNLALFISVMSLLGLALALILGQTSAREPAELVLLSFDGIGLMMLMLTLISFGRVQGWLERGSTQFIWMVIATLVAVLSLLFIVTFVRVWHQQPGHWFSVFLAGLCVTYLLTSVIHYLGFTDGYFYIVDMRHRYATETTEVVTSTRYYEQVRRLKSSLRPVTTNRLDDKCRYFDPLLQTG